jgi:chemotaxis signal transduction protein
MDFLGFTINGHYYAVRIDEAVATIRTPIITTVPGTTASVIGMFSHLGALIPVVDLSIMYGEEHTGESPFVIIVRGDADYGILADTIEKIIRNDVPDDFMCLSIHDIEHMAMQPPRDLSSAIELF